MQIKKMIFFDKPGEREKLNDLMAKYGRDEATFASAIEREFLIDFLDAMFIAERWLKVKRNKS